MICCPADAVACDDDAPHAVVLPSVHGRRVEPYDWGHRLPWVVPSMVWVTFKTENEEQNLPTSGRKWPNYTGTWWCSCRRWRSIEIAKTLIWYCNRSVLDLLEWAGGTHGKLSKSHHSNHESGVNSFTLFVIDAIKTYCSLDCLNTRSGIVTPLPPPPTKPWWSCTYRGHTRHLYRSRECIHFADMRYSPDLTWAKSCDCRVCHGCTARRGDTICCDITAINKARFDARGGVQCTAGAVHATGPDRPVGWTMVPPVPGLLVVSTRLLYFRIEVQRTMFTLH